MVNLVVVLDTQNKNIKMRSSCFMIKENIEKEMNNLYFECEFHDLKHI